jgi:hypothetical protein
VFEPASATEDEVAVMGTMRRLSVVHSKESLFAVFSVMRIAENEALENARHPNSANP